MYFFHLNYSKVTNWRNNKWATKSSLIVNKKFDKIRGDNIISIDFQLIVEVQTKLGKYWNI